MKYSKQRELILAAVLEHPVQSQRRYGLHHAQGGKPQPESATVYRYLNLLDMKTPCCVKSVWPGPTTG
jgi:Fe2+ or Zn2+ uptake regulation protein